VNADYIANFIYFVFRAISCQNFSRLYGSFLGMVFDAVHDVMKPSCNREYFIMAVIVGKYVIP
jgi:hypothetical protein